MPQEHENAVPPGAIKMIEGKADVESLEYLQHLRRVQVQEWKVLSAKFKGGGGNGSSPDAARKRNRAQIATRHLESLGNPKGKEAPSEAALERIAGASDEHATFCAALEGDFARYEELSNDIKELDERITSREIELRCYNGELYLSR